MSKQVTNKEVIESLEDLYSLLDALKPKIHPAAIPIPAANTLAEAVEVIRSYLEEVFKILSMDGMVELLTAYNSLDDRGRTKVKLLTYDIAKYQRV